MELQSDLKWDDLGVEGRSLSVDGNGRLFSFAWDSVLAVGTYKIDLWTTDCVCLAFGTSDTTYEIVEEMKGWDAFIDALPSRLPGFPLHEQWLSEVTFPAFETNHKRLWTRSEEMT